MPRPRVLIIAEAANPEWVSVPLIGWSLAAALSETADTHIVTQIRNRDAFLRAGLSEGADFTAINSEALAAPLWKIGSKLRMGEGKGWTIMQAVNALSYPLFERLVWNQFRGRIRSGEFDIVHRVTPLSPTVSSSIAAKCQQAGVPFVLGPLNGGVPWPKGFEAERLKEREWLSYLRSAYKFLPGRPATLKNAAAILVGSRHTESEIPSEYQDKCIYLPENAIDPTRFTRKATFTNGSLRACFVGRMVAYKGPDMLLEAAAPLLRDGRMTLDMIGDGPLLEQLKAQTLRDHTSASVNFHGWVPHEEVQNIMAETSLFTFPSIREFGGGVVLEAMALGIPPLIVDYAGPGELIRDGLGFKVPLGSRTEIVSNFREELTRIAGVPEILPEIGAAAFDHVRQRFTWNQKAAQVKKVYNWVLGNTTKPPSFF
ncbi:MAG: glycosyltransferase family 4 protein [Rhodobacteraceae bacterium]|nr:glycosyltransferase family 4 protein [Paracoccaceae bacterium]